MEINVINVNGSKDQGNISLSHSLSFSVNFLLRELVISLASLYS